MLLLPLLCDRFVLDCYWQGRGGAMLPEPRPERRVSYSRPTDVSFVVYFSKRNKQSTLIFTEASGHLCVWLFLYFIQRAVARWEKGFNQTYQESKARSRGDMSAADFFRYFSTVTAELTGPLECLLE